MGKNQIGMAMGQIGDGFLITIPIPESQSQYHTRPINHSFGCGDGAGINQWITGKTAVTHYPLIILKY